MAMTDPDRKKLWGQAAGTCSMCRKPLVHAADHPDDREALVGEEAHILSESRNGPRDTRAVPGMNFDGYYNRILLCRVDHRIIDGAEGQRFLNQVKLYLEDPQQLLVEMV